MAKFKIKLKLDEASLKKVLIAKQKLINENIRDVMKKEGIPFLIEKIMVGFDKLGDIADSGPEDPTNPSLWREEFRAQLHKDFAETFVFTGNRISVKLGDKEFLGYNGSDSIDPDDDTPLHWLVFYIEGLLGDWAFITPEVYQTITGRPYETGWGRFSDGFMVSKTDYLDQGWGQVVPFEQVRHPFSGFSPLDIFDEALREFKIRPFIKKAIDASIRGKKV